MDDAWLLLGVRSRRLAILEPVEVEVSERIAPSHSIVLLQLREFSRHIAWHAAYGLRDWIRQTRRGLTYALSILILSRYLRSVVFFHTLLVDKPPLMSGLFVSFTHA